MKTAELIIDSSEKNVDLYYATGFTAPDPFTYFKIDGKKYMLLSTLEIDRAKKDTHGITILPLAKYLEKVACGSRLRSNNKSGPNDKARSNSKNCLPTSLDAAIVALKERRVKKIIAPQSMPFTTVDHLKKKGFKVEAGPYPFYPSRLKKDAKETKYVLEAQTTVFSAMKLAEDMIRKASVKKGILYLAGKPLTSERMRSAIKLHLYERDLLADQGPIVACGNDGIDPHNVGSGPLRAGQSIIVDIYCKSMETLFYGDATRTFCKGRAPERLKKQYNTVKIAQEDAIKKIRPGVNGKAIHEGITNYFKEKGYPTGEMGGRMQGFIHGTGHGIGLELHEEPVRIKLVDFRLEEGFITSVEPGLYYKNIGGVRLEDLVYITKTGCKVLGYYPKKLEIE